MNLCSCRVIHLVKTSVKRSHFYGIVESVIRTSPAHLKVNYDNWIEYDVCKQCYHTICENFDPDIDERVFSSSDSSNESVNEDDSFVWYCRKCYEETSPAHLKVNYDN